MIDDVLVRDSDDRSGIIKNSIGAFHVQIETTFSLLNCLTIYFLV